MTACNQCLTATRDGKIVYYICRNPESRRFNKRVSPATRAACQGRRPGAQETPATQSAPADAEPPPQTPGLVRRVLSYAEALIQWTAAGKPERADDEVVRIFQQICKPCRWFDRRRTICRGCGCRVADSGFAITNKIKMATEHCPKNLW